MKRSRAQEVSRHCGSLRGTSGYPEEWSLRGAWTSLICERLKSSVGSCATVRAVRTAGVCVVVCGDGLKAQSWSGQFWESPALRRMIVA